jgi:protein gp37
MGYKIGKSKIAYATHGWSVATGCLHDCPYCYAKGIVNRFVKVWERTENQWREKSKYPVLLNIDESEKFRPYYFHHRIRDVEFPKQPARIFCTPLTDPYFWGQRFVQSVQDEIDKDPKHRYLFLTKNPACYEMFRPQESVWVGVTCTNREELSARTRKLLKATPGFEGRRFLSLEPLLGRGSEWNDLKKYNWVIVGGQNGKVVKVPQWNWIRSIMLICKTSGIPLFIKKSLNGVWDDELIQEYPKGLKLEKDKTQQSRI